GAAVERARFQRPARRQRHRPHRQGDAPSHDRGRGSGRHRRAIRRQPASVAAPVPPPSWHDADPVFPESAAAARASPAAIFDAERDGDRDRHRLRLDLAFHAALYGTLWPHADGRARPNPAARTRCNVGGEKQLRTGTYRRVDCRRGPASVHSTFSFANAATRIFRSFPLYPVPAGTFHALGCILSGPREHSARRAMMNGALKLPLLTTTAALVLVLGAMSSQADSPVPDKNDVKSAQAEQHSPAADSDDAAPASDDTSTADAGDQGDAQSNPEPASDVAGSSGDTASPEAEANNAATDNEVADASAGAAPAEGGAANAQAATNSDVNAATAVARSKSFTKSIVTPHMAMSITHSIGLAKDEDGDMAKAKAMAKAKVLDTPGQVRTDTMTKTSVKVEGDAEASAAATADAGVEDGSMSVQAFGETSVAVH